jgi:hypothetical protein
MTEKIPASRGLVVAGVLALIFGAMTLLEGGRTLALAPADRPEGVVFFVLAFNVGAGLFYLIAGAGILLRQAWSQALAWALAGSTGLVFLALAVHILRGGAFMPRTVAAMTLRTAFWFAQAWWLGKAMRRA